MRRWLALVEEAGDATLLARTIAERVGEVELRAAVGERCVVDAPPATSWPCDENEDGCPRRIVDNVGDLAHPRVAVCGRRERICDAVLLTPADCSRSRVSIEGLIEVLRRIFHVVSGGAGDTSTSVVALGAQRHGDKLREVVFVRRPRDREVAPLLELREGAARPTLVLVPTGNSLLPAMLTRYRPGSHVEIVVLEDVLHARGSAIGALNLATSTKPEIASAEDSRVESAAKDPRAIVALAMPRITKFAELRLYKIADQFVSVRTPHGHVRATPVDFGMAHAYTRDPTRAWEVLMKFLEGSGVYAGPPGMDSSSGTRQQIRRLTMALQRVFQLEEDPFEYMKRVGWRAKFRAYPDLPIE